MSSTERGGKEGSGSAEYPTPETVDERVFPDEFTNVDNWCVWRKIDGAKRPVQDDATVPMKWSDQSNWISHRDAMGLVATADVEPGFFIRDVPADTKRPVFFDFDDVRDPESDAVHPTVLEIIKTDDLYAMVSTSGTGIHAYGYVSEVPEDYLAKCEFPLPDDEKFPDATCEVYARKRFIAVTGNKLAGSADTLPNVTTKAEGLIRKHGREAHDAEKHEPERDREEIEDIEKTDDMNVIFDAIHQTKFSDLSLDSSVTNRRLNGSLDLDPAWGEESESGTRLGYNEDGFIYRKGGYHLDALQVVALEERIITDESVYPGGEDFHTALDKLRERGAPIPEYVTAEIDEETKEQVSENGRALYDDRVQERVYEMYEMSDDRLALRQEVAMLIAESDWFVSVERDEGPVDILKYNPACGIFEKNGETKLRKLLEMMLSKYLTNTEFREIKNKVVALTSKPHDEIQSPEGIICVENGVLDVCERELYDHSPEYHFRSSMNVKYDRDAECPLWEEFIHRIMLNKSHLKKIQEFVGYTLMAGEYPWHKGLFIVGETRSGKSTFLKIIKKLYDDDATSVVAPQDLSDDYDAARLHNSMVNIENDVDDAMIENVGAFKKILAGDEISAGRKYKAKLEFCPTAKHIFATNKLPTADVDDSAFYQRVLLTMTDGTIPPEDRREFEEDEVQERIVENELSGILNWALDGLDRRKKQGYFTADYPVDKTKTRWRAWARSPSRFEYDCIEPATSNAVTKDVLEESYTEFCECRNLPQQPWSELRDTLSKVSGADRTKTTRGGRTKRGINGIELIDEWHPDRELYEETDS